MTTKVNETGNQAQIRAIIDDWAVALRAKDAAGVVRHQAPDFVQFSLAPPLVATDADVKWLEAWFATWRGSLGYELRDVAITADAGVAFCHLITRLSGTKVDGQRNDVWFRQTLCFRKLGGEWKITHQHESVPFYMDGSFKAAVDLEP